MKKLYSIIFVLIVSIIGYAQPTNIDFSAGNLTGWSFTEAQNIDSYFMTNGTYSLSSKYALMMPGVLETNSVPVTMVSPLGGKFMRIGNTIDGGRSYKLSQTFNVNSSSEALSISYALIAKTENNYCNDKPYFNFVLKDNSGNIIPSSNSYYVVSGQMFPSTNCSSGDPSFATSGNYKYKDWITKNFSLQDYIGTNVTVEFIASGSTDSLSTQPLYAYVDAAICSNSFSPNILSVNTNTYNLLQSQNSILVCGTTTANVTAPIGATSYSWTGPGITGSTSQSVAINQAGKYQLIFNNSSACSNSTSVSFTIGANPTLTVSSVTNTVCSGNSFTMTASGAKNYTWTPFYNDTTGINTNFSASNIIYPYSSSTYSVLGADSIGCVSSSQLSFTVIPKPLLSVTGNTAICFGATASLTATGANTFTWVPGNSNNSTFTLTPFSNTTYTVIGRDASTGCTTNKIVNVLVDRNIQDNYFPSSICIGDSIVRTAIGATSYTWSTGATTNSVVLKPISNTVYTLSATSASCGFVQKTFSVTVNSLPSIVANATQTYVCTGASIKLFGSGGFSYLWSNGVLNNQLFMPSLTTVYTVTGTSSNGCKNNASITVSVVPSPTVTISSPSSFLCAGQTVTLTASGANSYTWNTTGPTTPTLAISPTTNTNYNVSGINSFGCIKTSSITSISVFTTSPTFTFANSIYTVCATNTNTILFNSGGAYNYTCTQPNTSFNGGLALNPSPLVPTTYTVTADNGCGTTSNTVQVVPQALPVLSIVAPDSVCTGSIFSYSVSGADLYSIAVSPASINYVYTAVNSGTAVAGTNITFPTFVHISSKYINGCRRDTTIGIKILPLPSVSIAGNSTLTCSSCTTNLMATGANAYTWSTGAATSSISVAPLSTNIYTVIGTGVNGCSASAKTTIIVQDSLTMCFNAVHGISGPIESYYNTADFNGDGHLDIVVSYFNSGQKLLIYFNSGNGTFLPPVIINVGHFAYQINISDLNQDSFPDIVFATAEAGITSSAYNAITYLNDGSGNFLGPNVYAIGGIFNTGARISMGDVNGDGFPDLFSSGFGKLLVFENTGIGTFGNARIIFNNTFASVSGDFNNDNFSDLVGQGGPSGDTIAVYINDGLGNFPSSQKYAYGLIGSSHRVSDTIDVNSDGNLDILTVTANSIFLLVNNGNGVFAPYISYPNAGDSPSKISSGDFNNDGFPDLVTCNASNINSSSIFHENVQVHLNNGNNTFHSPVNYYPHNFTSTLFSFGPIFVKDINSDSKQDILLIASTGITQDSIVFLLNTTTPTLTITPQTNSALCAGSSLSLTATGANTYTWSGGISNGVAFNPTQTQTYTVNATDVSGCSGYAVTTVSISPNLSIISSSPYVCIGSSASVTASGADTYSWSTGAITTSVSLSPTTTTVYSVTGSDISTGCSYTQTLSLIADSCENVWPGDANHDNVADNLDVLELGLHFNQTGFARATLSNTWQAFPAPTWIGTISNGDNLSHSDCNGDGIISNNDTLAIFNNYGLTHAKPVETTTVNPQITIVPDQAMVVKGNWGTASIYLGDATTLINNINGVAFTIDFDHTLIEPSNIYIEYQNSFIDASQNLHFRKLDFVNGKIYTASTHTINNNVNGFGKIATLHYRILSSLTSDQVLNIGLLQANQSNVSGLITPLTSGSGTLMAIGASVDVSQINTERLFTITPNPTNDLLTVISNDVMQSLTLTNIAGQVLLLEQITEKTHQLQLQNYADGIYFLKVFYVNGMSVTKKVVVNH